MAAIVSDNGFIGANLPPIPGAEGFPRLYDAENTVGNTIEVARAFQTGMQMRSPSHNRNAENLDLLARYLSGLYVVLAGFALSDGGGLSLGVGAGHAAIDGLVEAPNAQSVALTDNAVNRVWVQQSGVVVPLADSLGVPIQCPSKCAFLGTTTTVSGVITNIDTAGVSKMQGGVVYRATGDPGYPSDTPPSGSSLFTQTKGGLFFWTGAKYLPVGSPYETDFYYPGKPPSGGAIFQRVISRALLLPAGAVNSAARVLTPASVQGIFSLQKNGVTAGTFTFSTGNNTGTFQVTSDVAFSAGDWLTVLAPSPQDSALSDVLLTLSFAL